MAKIRLSRDAQSSRYRLESAGMDRLCLAFRVAGLGAPFSSSWKEAVQLGLKGRLWRTLGDLGLPRTRQAALSWSPPASNQLPRL